MKSFKQFIQESEVAVNAAGNGAAIAEISPVLGMARRKALTKNKVLKRTIPK